MIAILAAGLYIVWMLSGAPVGGPLNIATSMAVGLAGGLALGEFVVRHWR